MGNKPSRRKKNVVIDPVKTAAVQREIEQTKKETEDLQRKRADPLLFGLNEQEGFETFLNEIPKLMLPTIIERKSDNEWHIGFFGLTSVGKSTLINCVKKEKVADTGLGITTTERKLFFVSNGVSVWDLPGEVDGDFFKPENLGFLSNLDCAVFLYDKGVKDIERFVRTASKLRSGRKVICGRMKMDAVDKDEENSSIQEEGKYIENIVGKRLKFFALSGRNVWKNLKREGKENPFDFEKFLMEVITKT